jgi:hypothetical protein
MPGPEYNSSLNQATFAQTHWKMRRFDAMTLGASRSATE